MSRAKRTISEIKNLNRIAWLRAIPIDDITREYPGMTRGDAVRRFSVHFD